MKDKWHRKLPFVKVIEKGVLNLNQTSSVGEERKRKRKDRKKRKKRERKRQRKGGSVSAGLQCSNKQEVRRVRKRTGLRSER